MVSVQGSSIQVLGQRCILIEEPATKTLYKSQSIQVKCGTDCADPIVRGSLFHRVKQ